MSEEFWREYAEAYDKGFYQEEDVVVKLPIWGKKKGKSGLRWTEGLAPSGLTSYFNDLIDYMRKHPAPITDESNKQNDKVDEKLRGKMTPILQTRRGTFWDGVEFDCTNPQFVFLRSMSDGMPQIGILLENPEQVEELVHFLNRWLEEVKSEKPIEC